MAPVLSGADFPRPSEIKTYHIKSYDRINPTKSGFDGKGKTVFVTGGSAGIGFSICRAFAEAGVSKLFIVSRSPGPLEKAKAALNASYPNVKIEIIAQSITDLGAMTSAVESAGPIDVMVLNAYYSHRLNVPSSTVPTAEIEKTFQATVVANWHLMQTYTDSTPVPASDSKTIVAVTSAAAHLKIPLNSGYAASKAALSHLVGSLAEEYTPEKNGVRLFSMHPGVIWTDAARDQGFPEEGPVWEDVNVPGDFAVWLAGKESTFLHGRFLWAQWDVDDLIAAKERFENDRMFLQIGLVY